MDSGDVGQALALLRAERGLSQKELAAKLGLARETSVSSIETGNPTSRVVSGYLRALGLDYHALARALDVIAARGVEVPSDVQEASSTYASRDDLQEKVDQFKQALDDIVLAIREKHGKP